MPNLISNTKAEIICLEAHNSFSERKDRSTVLQAWIHVRNKGFYNLQFKIDIKWFFTFLLKHFKFLTNYHGIKINCDFVLNVQLIQKNFTQNNKK